MTIYELTLCGRIPSKKNSLRRIKRGKRVFTVPSKDYSRWHENLIIGLRNIEKIERKINKVSLKFYMPCNRKADLTNRAESVMDLLVDSEIIKDDCWQVVPRIDLICKGIDRDNPRVEIEITMEDLSG